MVEDVWIIVENPDEIIEIQLSKMRELREQWKKSLIDALLDNVVTEEELRYSILFNYITILVFQAVAEKEDCESQDLDEQKVTQVAVKQFSEFIWEDIEVTRNKLQKVRDKLREYMSENR